MSRDESQKSRGKTYSPVSIARREWRLKVVRTGLVKVDYDSPSLIDHDDILKHKVKQQTPEYACPDDNEEFMEVLASEFACPSCGGQKFKLENTYPTMDFNPPISSYDYRCQTCRALVFIEMQDVHSDGKSYVTKSEVVSENGLK